MAASLLIVVVLIFALRGLFLGLGGVVGKWSGFLLGYFIAYRYGPHLAKFLGSNTAINLPAIVLEMIAGVLLFTIMAIITGLMINTTFKLLGKLLPALSFISNKQSMAGKVTGATLNAALGVAIVLVAIAIYDQFRQQGPSDSPLHQIADSFGSQLFSLVSENSSFNIETFSQFTSSTTHKTISPNIPNNSQTSTGSSNTLTTGSAVIVSTTDPNKKLSIETSREIIKQITAGSKSFDNQQPQQILGNSDIRNMAENYLNDHPEQLQSILNNPELLQLIEKFQQQ